MPVIPSPRSARQLSGDNVLAAVITGLEVLQATSNIVGNVPYLSGIVGSALGLARTVQKVSGDRERYVRLARRASELSKHIEESIDIDEDPDAIDDKLRDNLSEIRDLLSRIQREVEKQIRRGSLSRFFHQSTIASSLDEYYDRLDCAWHTFDTACLIALRMKVERQAMWNDRSQLHLFRWSHLKLLKVRGTYRVGTYEVGQEWEAKWDGRVVVVRTVKKQPQFDYRSLIEYHPDLHHPYVGQILGYSHPALNDRFYVMETGVIPLMHQFRGKDIFSRLLLWLQHIVDYQNAFRYVEALGISSSTYHSHDRCLSSAMLNENGRLIIDASDFSDSNPGCFQYYLRTLCDEDCGALSPGRGEVLSRFIPSPETAEARPIDFANDDDISSHASSLLDTLRSHTGTHSTSASLDVEPFIHSNLANSIWASHEFQSSVDANWGDYGYIQRDPDRPDTFVRLGHVYDLVKPTGKISTFLLRRLSGGDWQRAVAYPWPSRANCHTFTFDDLEGRVRDLAVVRTLPDDSEYHDFFWNQAENIAQEHGVALHDIIMFEETFHYAFTELGDQPNDQAEDHEEGLASEDIPSFTDIPSKIYFHQLPFLTSGKAHSPWGYWSLEPDPVPGPWPVLKIPGVKLTCPVRSNYVRVSSFEAEILVYMNSLRRRRDWQVHSSGTPRFEEVS